MHQAIDVHNGVGHQHAHDDGVGEDGVAALQQIGRHPGHEQDEEGQRQEQEGEAGVVHAQRAQHQQPAGDERRGGAEKAGALPDRKGHQRHRQQQQQTDAVLQEERSQQQRYS